MKEKTEIWTVQEVRDLIDDEWKNDGIGARIDDCLGDDWRDADQERRIEIVYQSLRIDSDSRFWWSTD